MTLKNEVSVSLGLPAVPITQDPELSLELTKVYNAIRALARAIDLNTGALGEEPAYWDQATTSRCTFGKNSVLYLEAGENLAYSNLIGIKSDGKAWKADDGVLRCIGFCTVKAGVSTGDFVEVQVAGIYPAFPAATLTPGNFYYLSTTAGVVGAAGSGPTYNQIVGFAVSDTILFFLPQL
jgi:hypothetical protein